MLCTIVAYFCYISTEYADGILLIANIIHNIVTLLIMCMIIWVQEVLNFRWENHMMKCPQAIQYVKFQKVSMNKDSVIDFLNENSVTLSTFCSVNSKSLVAVIFLSIVLNVNYSLFIKDYRSDHALEYICHNVLIFICFEEPVRKISSYNTLILDLRSALLFDKESNVTVKFFNSVEPDRGFIVSFYVSLLFFILKVSIG